MSYPTSASGSPRRCCETTQLLAFCQLGADGTARTPCGEAMAQLAGVKETDPRTILTEMCVNAVRIQETLADPSEHE